MNEKYSREKFKGYTHRFKVDFFLQNGGRTSLDIYSNCQFYTNLMQFIDKNKSEKVVTYKVVHQSSKEQDEMAAEFINSVFNDF